MSAVKTWDDLNTDMTNRCLGPSLGTEAKGVHKFQAMNLLTFLQVLRDRNTPVDNISYTTHHADLPVVFTLDFKYFFAKNFMIVNVTFFTEGNLLLTFSDFRHRKYSEWLFRLLLFPKWKRNFFNYYIDNTECSHEVMNKVVNILDDVRNGVHGDKSIKQFEQHCNEVLDAVASHK